MGQNGTAATLPFRVDIAEITKPEGTVIAGGDAASVLFNGDQSNPTLVVSDSTSERHSPRIFNPDDPTKTTPRISNPQVANPQVANPQVANPQVANPQVANPQVANPQVANSTFFVAPTDATPVAASAARPSARVALVAFQPPTPAVDDATLAINDAATLITLSIQSGDTPIEGTPPPPRPGQTQPPAVDPPLTEADFSDGGSAAAVTAPATNGTTCVLQATAAAATTGADLVIFTPPTFTSAPNATVPAGTAITISAYTGHNTGHQATGRPFLYGVYLSTTFQI